MMPLIVLAVEIYRTKSAVKESREILGVDSTHYEEIL